MIRLKLSEKDVRPGFSLIELLVALLIAAVVGYGAVDMGFGALKQLEIAERKLKQRYDGDMIGLLVGRAVEGAMRGVAMSTDEKIKSIFPGISTAGEYRAVETAQLRRELRVLHAIPSGVWIVSAPPQVLPKATCELQMTEAPNSSLLSPGMSRIKGWAVFTMSGRPLSMVSVFGSTLTLQNQSDVPVQLFAGDQLFYPRYMRFLLIDRRLYTEDVTMESGAQPRTDYSSMEYGYFDMENSRIVEMYLRMGPTDGEFVYRGWLVGSGIY